MLTCVARPKQQHGSKSAGHHFQRDESDSVVQTPNSKQPIKSFTSQIKGIAVKASGAYKCNPCSHPGRAVGGPAQQPSEPSVKPGWQYRRTTSTNSSAASTPRWGKEMEARLKAVSVGKGVGVGVGEEVVSPTMEMLAASASGRRVDPVVVLVEESEPEEWVAQVEPGVLITLVSLPRGGNDLKRIRFNQDIFNQWQAQKWWTDNYKKVMELYNVQRLSRHAFPLPNPPRSNDENSKMESIGDSPITPPLSKEGLPRNLYPGMGMGYSSSDSFEQHSKQSHQYNESSSTLASTPKNSNISGVTAKTEASSMDESLRSTPSRDADRSEEMSVSNASDTESEWVEEDEPGVYITIRALPGGRKELRRVRFSREIFGEMHARVWWEENRSRIHEQYL